MKIIDADKFADALEAAAKNIGENHPLVAFSESGSAQVATLNQIAKLVRECAVEPS